MRIEALWFVFYIATGVPLAIWTLIVLCRRDVREAFAINAKMSIRASGTRTSRSGAMLTAVAIAAVLTGVFLLFYFRISSSTSSSPLTRADHPEMLRELPTGEVIQAGLANPLTPWPWQELQQRQLTGSDAAQIIESLTAWLHRDYPDGFRQPLPWLAPFLDDLAKRDLFTKEETINFLEAFYGNPHLNPPMLRLRENARSVSIACEWRSPWERELMGMVLLNDVRGVTIDGQPVAPAHNHFQGDQSVFMDSFPLPALTPGAHTLKMEIVSGIVSREDADVVAASGAWSHASAEQLWTRTASMDLMIYARDAAIVNQTQNPALDPLVTGGISIKRAIIQPRGPLSDAAVEFEINDKLTVPISFDVSFRAGGKTGRCGQLVYYKGPGGVTYGNNSGILLASGIQPLDPAIKEADVILTPNPQPVEENGVVSYIWGKPVVFSHVPLVRQDLLQTPGAELGAAPIFGLQAERKIATDDADSQGLVFFRFKDNNFVKPPFPLKLHMNEAPFVELTPELKQWIKEQDVDVLFHFGKDLWDLVTLETQEDFAGQPTDWETVPAWQAPVIFAKKDADHIVRNEMPASSFGHGYRDGWGMVSAFRTRGNLIGIWQMRGVDITPGRGVEIRFKISLPAPVAAKLAPETVSQTPQLRFLGWQNENTEMMDRRAWHPDGTPVQDKAELKLMDYVRPTLEDVKDTAEGKKDPRFLFLWFSHPEFEDGSYNHVTLFDSDGKQLQAGGAYASGATHATTENGNVGWIAYTISPGYAGHLPASATVRLDYSAGLWKIRKEEIPANYNGGMSLGDTAMLGSIGQNTEGHAFISLTRNDLQSPAIQYDFVALTRDGREVTHTSLGSNSHNNILNETYEFPVKLEDVQGFRFRSRPIKTTEFKNVPLLPERSVAAKPISSPQTSATPPVSANYISEQDGKPPMKTIHASLTLSNPTQKPLWFILPWMCDKPAKLVGPLRIPQGFKPDWISADGFNTGTYYSPASGSKGKTVRLTVLTVENDESFCLFLLPAGGRVEFADYQFEMSSRYVRDFKAWTADEVKVNGTTSLRDWLPYDTFSDPDTFVPASAQSDNLNWSKKLSGTRDDFRKEPITQLDLHITGMWQIPIANAPAPQD